MNRSKKLDFLINFAYWTIIIAGICLGLKFILPVSVPFIFGILIAWLVVWISRKVRCTHRFFRLGLTVLIYGVLALLVILVVSKSVSAIPGGIRWLQRFYELKLLPFVLYCYDWCSETISHFDPTLISALRLWRMVWFLD